MLQLAQHATTLPLYIGSITDHPPPLVGAIAIAEDKPIPVGDFVAAYVEDIWILAEVKVIQLKKYFSGSISVAVFFSLCAKSIATF